MIQRLNTYLQKTQHQISFFASRYRVRGGTDRFLRGLLLQRHHCLGSAVLLRIFHYHAAVDQLRQRVEHSILPTCQFECIYSFSLSEEFSCFKNHRAYSLKRFGTRQTATGVAHATAQLHLQLLHLLLLLLNISSQ